MSAVVACLTVYLEEMYCLLSPSFLHGEDSTKIVVPVTNPPAMVSVSQQSTPEAPSSVPLARPSLVPLGSSNVQPFPLTSVGLHPKRFSAVNINKKFLENTTRGRL